MRKVVATLIILSATISTSFAVRDDISQPYEVERQLESLADKERNPNSVKVESVQEDKVEKESTDQSDETTTMHSSWGEHGK